MSAWPVIVAFVCAIDVDRPRTSEAVAGPKTAHIQTITRPKDMDIDSSISRIRQMLEVMGYDLGCPEKGRPHLLIKLNIKGQSFGDSSYRALGGGTVTLYDARVDVRVHVSNGARHYSRHFLSRWGPPRIEGVPFTDPRAARSPEDAPFDLALDNAGVQSEVLFLIVKVEGPSALVKGAQVFEKELFHDVLLILFEDRKTDLLAASISDLLDLNLKNSKSDIAGKNKESIRDRTILIALFAGDRIATPWAGAIKSASNLTDKQLLTSMTEEYLLKNIQLVNDYAEQITSLQEELRTGNYSELEIRGDTRGTPFWFRRQTRLTMLAERQTWRGGLVRARQSLLRLMRQVYLKDPEPLLRIRAVRLIGKCGDVACVGALRNTLQKEEDQEVRQAIAAAILMLKSRANTETDNKARKQSDERRQEIRGQKKTGEESPEKRKGERGNRD